MLCKNDTKWSLKEKQPDLRKIKQIHNLLNTENPSFLTLEYENY